MLNAALEFCKRNLGPRLQGSESAAQVNEALDSYSPTLVMPAPEPPPLMARLVVTRELLEQQISLRGAVAAVK